MPKILLHSCCAPCGGQVINELKSQGFEVTVFFYNPNIFPLKEHETRKQEIAKFCQSENVEFIVGDWQHQEWLKYLLTELKLNNTGSLDSPSTSSGSLGINFSEGGERCFKCYEFRLRETAQYAKKNNFDYFASTLSISPHKKAEKINEIGKKLEPEYSCVDSSLPTGVTMLNNVKNTLKFFTADWKKHDGFKKSCELSKTHNFYRQTYCGCEFSFPPVYPERLAEGSQS